MLIHSFIHSSEGLSAKSLRRKPSFRSVTTRPFGEELGTSLTGWRLSGLSLSHSLFKIWGKNPGNQDFSASVLLTKVILCQPKMSLDIVPRDKIAPLRTTL